MPDDRCSLILRRIEANLVIVMFQGFFLPDVENEKINSRKDREHRAHTVVSEVISLWYGKVKTRGWRRQQQEKNKRDEISKAWTGKVTEQDGDENLKAHLALKNKALGQTLCSTGDTTIYSIEACKTVDLCFRGM